MGTNAHDALRQVAEPVQAPAADVRYTCPAVAENVTAIRSGIGAFAAAAGLPSELVDDIRIALTEAVTNVVRHAYEVGAPGEVDVAVRLEHDLVQVVVSDDGRGLDAASADAAGPGLGLPLIAALASTLELRSPAAGGCRLEMTFDRRRRVAA